MKKVLIFDLDDTLYLEISFVKSGFFAVADYLIKQHRLNFSKETLAQEMMEVLSSQGRGQVFDAVLKKHQLFNQKNLKKCVSAYRQHQPNITLPKESVDCLLSFQSYPIYVVTDGNKRVQRNKIDALGLDQYVKKAMPTHNYGLKAAKPSTYCFDLIKKWEQVDYKQMLYVGDNPHKDFVGIKPLGMQTLRVHQGMFKTVKKSKAFNADHGIMSIAEFDVALLERIF